MTKGFTLLELLIVIAILAILSTVVVLVLNPAEYLAQARDSQRISDLSALNSVLSLYLANTSSTPVQFCPNIAPANIYCTASGNIPGASGGSPTACTPALISSSTAIGTAGWIPVDFTSIPGGSPLGKKPIDPTNSTTYKYAYGCDQTPSYEMSAKLESSKFKHGGAADKESNDGGLNVNAYEIGSNLLLLPAN